jgi:uncharacterized membrane protein
MEAFHPLAVHLPIALVLLWPCIDLIGLLNSRSDVSAVAFALLLLAIPAALFATVSGQSAYDAAVARGAPTKLLDTHGDLAGLVPWLLLALAAVRAIAPRKLGRHGRWFAIALGALMAALIVWIARSGGLLVFEHGIGVSTAGAPR